jgi:hypothetical protein
MMKVCKRMLRRLSPERAATERMRREQSFTDTPLIVPIGNLW